MRAFWTVLPALLSLTGCADWVTGPTVGIGGEFQLRPSEAATVEGTDLRVRFEAVTSDSRCPADALCVTQGDATAVFTVRAGGSAASLALHTAAAEGRRGAAGAFTLTLVRLDPYPYAGRPISAPDYRASLRVDPALDH